MDTRLSDIVLASRESAAAISDVFNRVSPDLAIGVPGFYTSMLCEQMGIRHISVLHGPWLAHEYDVSRSERAFCNIIDRCNRLYEIIDVVAAIVAAHLGHTYTNYRDWFDRQSIWVAQDFNIPIKSPRPVIGFLIQDYGQRSHRIPSGCLAVTVGTALPDIDPCIIDVLKECECPVVAVSHSQKDESGGVIWYKELAIGALAKKARAAITHGGISTVAIFANKLVPQVLVPHEIDAAVNAMLAQYSGFGEAVGLDRWHLRAPLGRMTPRLRYCDVKHLVKQALTATVPQRPRVNSRHLIDVALSNM